MDTAGRGVGQRMGNTASVADNIQAFVLIGGQLQEAVVQGHRLLVVVMIADVQRFIAGIDNHRAAVHDQAAFVDVDTGLSGVQRQGTAALDDEIAGDADAGCIVLDREAVLADQFNGQRSVDDDAAHARFRAVAEVVEHQLLHLQLFELNLELLLLQLVKQL
mgnify:CR=1 FL=1